MDNQAKQENIATSQGQAAKNVGMESILGDVTFLMMRSKGHQQLFVSDLAWLVLPALRFKQMRVFRGKRGPLAYCSWAYLSETAENRLLSGQGRLAPRDWKSGSRLWIIDSISAPGAGYSFFKMLQEQVFKGQSVKLLRPRKDRKGYEGVELDTVVQNLKAKAVKKYN